MILIRNAINRGGRNFPILGLKWLLFFQHKCQGSCKYCHGSQQCQRDIIRTFCSECNIIYPNNACYTKHKERKLCGHIRRCIKCDVEYISRYVHECTVNRCEKCSLNVKIGHSCFIKPLKYDELTREDEKTRILIFLILKATIELMVPELRMNFYIFPCF